jgi:hypothetical protein
MISTGSDKKRWLSASGQGWLRASRFDAHLDLAFPDIHVLRARPRGWCIPVSRDEL